MTPGKALWTGGLEAVTEGSDIDWKNAEGMGRVPWWFPEQCLGKEQNPWLKERSQRSYGVVMVELEGLVGAELSGVLAADSGKAGRL